MSGRPDLSRVLAAMCDRCGALQATPHTEDDHDAHRTLQERYGWRVGSDDYGDPAYVCPTCRTIPGWAS